MQPALIPWIEFHEFARCREHRGFMIDGWEPGDAVWASLTWFPVLFDGRNALAVECEQGDEHGSVALASLDEVKWYPLFGSIGELVEAATAAFDEGHFRYEEGYLEPPTEDVHPLDWLAEYARSRRETE